MNPNQKNMHLYPLKMAFTGLSTKVEEHREAAYAVYTYDPEKNTETYTVGGDLHGMTLNKIRGKSHPLYLASGFTPTRPTYIKLRKSSIDALMEAY
jgi:hypothetical protein